MAWPKVLLRLGRVLSPLIVNLAASKATQTVQEKAENYLDRKRMEFVSHAKTEAEHFMLEQIAVIETKVDLKLAEIEQKIDQQIEKELRSKLRILSYTLLFVILMSAVSLLYLYIKNRMLLG